ncbi:hypothetical protein [Virgibacillus halodenitrificans]|uniref:hypothetical protein n=1 Tax=Virgibacillus halodenitrificans TaxID=1482 RepID=UPI0013CEB154|nr:hypothetical protein [Virgibacillus halodenitrificans]
MNNSSKVLLPAWIFEQAHNQRELKQIVIDYLRVGYPDYTMIKINGRLAICEINRN